MRPLQKISLGILSLCFLISFSSGAQTRAVEFNEEPVFKVFPNPNQPESETYVSVESFKAQDLLVVVYDMLGREIYSKIEVRENDGFLFTLSSDGKKLPSGVYLITASANDRIFRQKLIVR